ncbi:MAG: hypothetical protein AAGI45_22565, partial [Cyanobacteria bacterium P01_H01_bin.26]
MVTHSITPVFSFQDSTKTPKFFTLQDGRQLAYECVGEPNGRPVFFFHGSPGSRLEILSATAAALDHGWQI